MLAPLGVGPGTCGFLQFIVAVCLRECAVQPMIKGVAVEEHLRMAVKEYLKTNKLAKKKFKPKRKPRIRGSVRCSTTCVCACCPRSMRSLRRHVIHTYIGALCHAIAFACRREVAGMGQSTDCCRGALWTSVRGRYEEAMEKKNMAKKMWKLKRLSNKPFVAGMCMPADAVSSL